MVTSSSHTLEVALVVAVLIVTLTEAVTSRRGTSSSILVVNASSTSCTSSCTLAVAVLIVAQLLVAVLVKGVLVILVVVVLVPAD